ncbi:sce7725 family protein [Paenibacillus sp. FSL R5-0490]|uniref:sce7725 family protein n=1 Tax=unclassified Paenibacillus TaxID=185978 RepID=UPI0030D04B20
MYFPFLRGKQNELFAINELNFLIKESQKVTPIIEPVNLNSTTRRILPEINNSGVPFVLIVNPQTGDLSNKGYEIYNPLLEVFENKNIVSLGYFITESTSISELEQVMNFYKEFSFSFIYIAGNYNILNFIEGSKEKRDIDYHIFQDGKVSNSFSNSFKQFNRVIIKDCFNRLSRNADYQSAEYYSDLICVYRPDFFGFGDYQVIGSGTGGGGPAHAVALHLTYKNSPESNEIWIRHFVSDDKEGTSNVQGKYFQALSKLVEFLNEYNNTPETIGAKQFRDNLADGVFHQLGFPKKLSVKHHIELMIQLLEPDN